MNLCRWGEGSEAGKSSSVMDERKSEVDATIRGELSRLPSYVFFHCMLTRVATTNSTNKNQIANKKRRQKLVIFSTTGIVGSSESQDCYDDASSMIHNHIDALGKYGNSVEGVILKEGLCVNLDWWDGGPGAGKERGRVSTRRLTLGINQLEFKSE